MLIMLKWVNICTICFEESDLCKEYLFMMSLINLVEALSTQEN